MALGRRGGVEEGLWVATTELPRSPGHPFYERVNQVLNEAGFDRFVEDLCGPHYAETQGRPSIPPGTYFRMLMVGYFEGINSQRGIAWRCSDSLALREFLGLAMSERAPDHSSLTVIRQRLPLGLHEEVFAFVLRMLIERGLYKGKTLAVDATMLEANAAMKSIVRRDSGEGWKKYIKRLAEEAGIENPTEEDARRLDRKRKKRVSNKDWESPTDPESRIAKMKDGRTHLAYKAEHVVDLKTDLVLAAVVYEANRGDAETLAESVVVAQKNIIQADSPANIKSAAADKGYHSAETLALVNGPLGVRTYIPEPKRKTRWKWRERPAEQQAAVTGNGRRVRGARGKRLQRLRSELTERTFAHVCETGGARRCWLQGMVKVAKRYLLQVAARNLSLIMRKLFGMGTPRGLQAEGDASSPVHLIHALLATVWIVLRCATHALQSRALIALENRGRQPRLAPAA